MPEKGGHSTSVLCSSPVHQWRFGILTALVFVGMVIVWSIDGCTINGIVEAWRLKKQNYLPLKVNNTPPYPDLTHTHESIAQGHQNLYPNNFSLPNNLTQNQANVTHFASSNQGNLTQNEDNPVSVPSSIGVGPMLPNPKKEQRESQVAENLKWVSAELEPNFTSNLLARWLAPGGEPCRDSHTVNISIPGLDGGNLIELSAGEIHEFAFQALDESGNPRCLGGDYFETDLSGESWKSRPIVKDFGNGSYSISLQVHPDFAGVYNLSVILLFRHFEGLKFSTERFAYDKELLKAPIKFYRTKSKLAELQICRRSDFDRDVWSGRWTRHGKNDDCQISYDGRYRCLTPDFPCPNPWCNGSLGVLESNGWVYSTHCSFKMFTGKSAWNCINKRWIFFWGDSNHVDTIRNMLNFILGVSIPEVPRRFDMNFTNPKNPSQSVRITSIFNGHWNVTQNYLGLDSLKDEGFRDLVKKYFSEETVPDTIIINSGLHDGIHWRNMRQFTAGADYAISFWKEVMESVRQRGLVVPRVIFRTTVATGGYARALSFNPSKIEAFNGILVEKLRHAGLLSGVIDNFDITFPWHFDNRCSDGVHYGRAPAKRLWRDGQIGHQYFVDLMLAHILLNALCAR